MATDLERLERIYKTKIERLQRENAAAHLEADRIGREYAVLGSERDRLKAKLAAAEAAALAYQQLSMCYRIGKRPTEKLFKQLEKANTVCAAIAAAKTVRAAVDMEIEKAARRGKA